MFELLIQVTDLPAEGREVSFTEPRIWTDPLAEYRLPWRLGSKFRADLMIQPHDKGCLVGGTMSGSVVMPCSRCSEELEYAMDVEVEEFEPYPGTSASDEACWIVARQGLLYLDAAGFLWEQFDLALPVKILCSPSCRGICSACGANKNLVACECAGQADDPRWDVLRSLHLS